MIRESKKFCPTLSFFSLSKTLNAMFGGVKYNNRTKTGDGWLLHQYMYASFACSQFLLFLGVFWQQL